MSFTIVLLYSKFLASLKAALDKGNFKSIREFMRSKKMGTDLKNQDTGNKKS